MERVLVVAPHADDETLGCGGTLLRHFKNGDEIFWLIATAPIESKSKTITSECIKKVADMYQFKKVITLDIAATTIDQRPMFELVDKISEVVSSVRPSTIYLPNRTDIHSDHRIVFEAAYSCTKNFRFPTVRRILLYETLSQTEFAPALPESTFIPNVFVDITDHMQSKLEIMSIYSSEVMEKPGPRSLSSLEALARYRGSRIGVEFSEAFALLFESHQ
jgi:LmbE family N-acetylglucosaminyl deacetylase